MTGKAGGVVIQLLIAVAVAALALAAVEKIPFAAMGERWLADWRQATLAPAEPQHPDIVVVAVTEDTLRRFPYRSPVDRAFLAALLRKLDDDGVRAIGVDVLFDQPTEADKDAILKATLAGLRAPVAVSVAGPEDGLSPEQVAWMEAFVPPSARGFANLAKDGWDGTVRTVFPGRDTAEGFVPGLPGAIAARLGVTPPRAALPIAWHGAPAADTPPFRVLPAHAVAVLPRAWLADKIVLVGADLTLTDRHRTPFSVVRRGPAALMAGVEIHAHALAQILDRRPPPLPAPWVPPLVALLAALAGVLASRLPGGLWVKGGVAVAAVAAAWAGAFAFYHAGGALLPLVAPTLAFGGALWSADVYGNRQDRKMKAFILGAFSKYVSPGIVSQLVADPGSLKLGGERREISILFTDLAGFTTLSEQVGPEALGPLLNAYLGGLSRIIIGHEGTIVDFIGDAVLAIFGAPLCQEDHRKRALACARDIDAYANAFRAEPVQAGYGWGVTRIGVHCGTVLIGNFGADLRFKYSPVGDAVNTASRLEGLNKYFGSRLLASAEVLAGDSGDSRPVGRIVVKGRADPIEVFELLDAAQAADGRVARYHDAYCALDRGDPAGAEAVFATLRADWPQDACTELHLRRIREGHRDTVIVMADK